MADKTKDARNRLHAAAVESRRGTKDIAAAAQNLATALSKDFSLLVAIAVEYLERIEDGKATPSPKNKTTSRRREGPHRSPKLPTAAQKAGAVHAEAQYTDAIFTRRLRGGKRLGEIRIHELNAIAQSSATTATSFLQRGYEDAVEAIACTMLSKHCVAADPFTLVADVIKGTVASKIFERAKVTAAQVIRDGSAKVADDLLTVARKSPAPLEASP